MALLLLPEPRAAHSLHTRVRSTTHIGTWIFPSPSHTRKPCRLAVTFPLHRCHLLSPSRALLGSDPPSPSLTLLGTVGPLQRSPAPSVPGAAEGSPGRRCAQPLSCLLSAPQLLPPGRGPERRRGESVPGAERLPGTLRSPRLLRRQGGRAQGPNPGRGWPRRPRPQDHGYVGSTGGHTGTRAGSGRDHHCVMSRVPVDGQMTSQAPLSKASKPRIAGPGSGKGRCPQAGGQAAGVRRITHTGRTQGNEELLTELTNVK